MTLEETLSKLNQMKCYGMAHSLENRLQEAAHQEITHEQLIALLIDDEWIARENRKLQRRLKSAKFKCPASLSDIDFRTHRGLDKSKFMDLSSLKWIRAKQNMIITGPTGVGKSFIAQALGHQACQRGISTHYIRLSLLLDQIFLENAQGNFAKFLLKLRKYDLLIIDDWGMVPLKDFQAQHLLEIIEDRHEINSTMITTQLPTEHWHEFIQNQTIADAICDRMVHGSIKINLKGESMRKIKNILNQYPLTKLDT